MYRFTNVLNKEGNVFNSGTRRGKDGHLVESFEQNNDTRYQKKVKSDNYTEFDGPQNLN